MNKETTTLQAEHLIDEGWGPVLSHYIDLAFRQALVDLGFCIALLFCAFLFIRVAVQQTAMRHNPFVCLMSGGVLSLAAVTILLLICPVLVDPVPTAVQYLTIDIAAGEVVTTK